jgi:hypothetical protein
MEERRIFLKKLCEGLEASYEAYKNYLAGGKTFRYALELKTHNTALTSLLISQQQGPDNDLRPDIEALLVHYDAWTKKWEQLATTLQPAPDDTFVFENDITFPRQSARRLEEVYLALSGQ